MNKLNKDNQEIIYSYYSNRCQYPNEVELKYKVIFEKVLEELVNINDVVNELKPNRFKDMRI